MSTPAASSNSSSSSVRPKRAAGPASKAGLFKVSPFLPPYEPQQRIRVTASMREYAQYLRSGAYSDWTLIIRPEEEQHHHHHHHHQQQQQQLSQGSGSSSQSLKLLSALEADSVAAGGDGTSRDFSAAAANITRTYKVHRIILARSSGYFEALFRTALGRSEPASSSSKSAAASDSDRVTSLDDDLDSSAAEGACTSIIQLPAVLIPHVQSLLEFLYEGHTLVTPCNAGPLLVLADRFMVPGLDSLLLAFIEQWTQPFENIHNRMELDPQLLFYTLKLAQLFPAHLASAHEQAIERLSLPSVVKQLAASRALLWLSADMLITLLSAMLDRQALVQVEAGLPMVPALIEQWISAQYEAALVIRHRHQRDTVPNTFNGAASSLSSTAAAESVAYSPSPLLNPSAAAPDVALNGGAVTAKTYDNPPFVGCSALQLLQLVELAHRDFRLGQVSDRVNSLQPAVCGLALRFAAELDFIAATQASAEPSPDHPQALDAPSPQELGYTAPAQLPVAITGAYHEPSSVIRAAVARSAAAAPGGDSCVDVGTVRTGQARHRPYMTNHEPMLWSRGLPGLSDDARQLLELLQERNSDRQGPLFRQYPRGLRAWVWRSLLRCLFPSASRASSSKPGSRASAAMGKLQAAAGSYAHIARASYPADSADSEPADHNGAERAELLPYDATALNAVCSYVAAWCGSQSVPNFALMLMELPVTTIRLILSSDVLGVPREDDVVPIVTSLTNVYAFPGDTGFNGHTRKSDATPNMSLAFWSCIRIPLLTPSARHHLLRKVPDLEMIEREQQQLLETGALTQRVNLAGYSVDISGHVLMLTSAPAPVVQDESKRSRIRAAHSVFPDREDRYRNPAARAARAVPTTLTLGNSISSVEPAVDDAAPSAEVAGAFDGSSTEDWIEIEDSKEAAHSSGQARGKTDRVYEPLEQAQVPASQTESEVLKAYLAFFNHITLRNNWRSVPFTREQVMPALQQAARIVCRIRKCLDSLPDFSSSTPSSAAGLGYRGAVIPPFTSGGSFKLRVLEGAVHEFLWTVKHVPQPSSAELDSAADQAHSAEVDAAASPFHSFVRDLVHHTFRDGAGYVEGLTPLSVDRYIAAVSAGDD